MGGKDAPPLLSAFKTTAAPPRKIAKAALIYNPVSGKKKGERWAREIVEPMLRAAHVEVMLLPTQHAGHATEIAASHDLDGCDALLALGGDGTLSDVVTGFLRREHGREVIALGFIPGGTGNTVSHDVYGGRIAGAAGVRKAVESILVGHTREIDVTKLACTGPDGRPLERMSINIVTAGLGVDANAAAEQRRWMGPARYDASILLEVLKVGRRKACPCVLEVDGRRRSLDLFVLTIMNNKHSGVGLRISPHAQLDDGKIDIMYTPKRIRSVFAAMRLDGLIKSKGKHVHDQLVEYTHAVSTIKLEGEAPVKIMCDGDICGTSPLEMTVMPQALTLFTPRDPPGC